MMMLALDVVSSIPKMDGKERSFLKPEASDLIVCFDKPQSEMITIHIISNVDQYASHLEEEVPIVSQSYRVCLNVSEPARGGPPSWIEQASAALHPWKIQAFVLSLISGFYPQLYSLYMWAIMFTICALFEPFFPRRNLSG